MRFAYRRHQAHLSGCAVETDHGNPWLIEKIEAHHSLLVVIVEVGTGPGIGSRVGVEIK